MRSLKKISITAAVLSVLLASTGSMTLAQQRDRTTELERMEELSIAGRYSDAIPIAQRLLALDQKARGRNHLNVANSLANLAHLYEAEGRYADAEPLRKRSLAIVQKASGRYHPDVATALFLLAMLYRYQGRDADAVPLHQRSLAIREKVLDTDHPDIATSLNSLAMVYHNLGRGDDAESLYRRSLAIREKVLGGDHADVAATLQNLAKLYAGQLFRFTDAEPLYRRSLAIYEKALGRDHPDIATPLGNLAEMLESQGRYAESEPLLQRSLEIREKALGGDHLDVAKSVNNLAFVYDHTGRYADAESLYKRSWEIQEKALGPNHPDVAVALNNLAALYVDQGRYADSEPLLQRSLEIREKALGRNHWYVAQSLNNLAVLYGKEGRYADAELLYQRSLKINEKALGPGQLDVAVSLRSLASVYVQQGRHAEAESLLQRSLEIDEKTLGRDHPRVADSLHGLAGLRRIQRRYADAEPLLQRSLAIREKTGEYPANELNDLAYLYAGQGRYADAEPLFQRALMIREKVLGLDHPDVAQSVNSLAALYDGQGRYADALPIVRRTIAQGTAEKDVSFPVLFGSRRLNLISAAQALTDSYEIVQRASLSAAANAVSKLAARFAAGSGDLAQLVRRDQDLISEAEILGKAVLAFVSMPPAERSAAAEEAIRKRIEAVKSERERLSQVFDQRFPDYVALSKPQPVPLAETQAVLAEDEALLVFDFDTKSYAWIVTKTDADWTELTISGSELDAQVAALRAGLMQRFDPALAHRIYQSTFGAFAERIAGKKRLSIITNGALTSLPPQILVTKDPSGKALREVDWLVRSHTITILPSAASLKVLRSRSQVSSSHKPMIAFADPVFSKGARARAQRQLATRSITSFYRGTQIDIAALGEYLPQLPSTRDEVKEIAAQLKTDPSDIKLGLAATETAVKQAKLDQYQIVYFATHGLVSGDLEPFAKSKAEPALALTIPDRPNDFDDGLLAASEIAQLKLDADWVVLSACNTASEEKPGAEALSGLARAFFYAGARSLIVSYWSVNDETTARLMVGTFQAASRDQKLSHAEALQQSMLAMIDAARTDNEANPRLWGAFVVVGEPTKPQ